MTARIIGTRRLTSLAAALVTLAAPAVAIAQVGQVLRPGQTAGPRLMVPVLRGQEKLLGFKAADAIRERMMSDIDIRSAYIVPRKDLTTALSLAGYDTTEALPAVDTRSLAAQVHADEYFEGDVTKTTTGTFRLEAKWALVRGDGMVQPLPVFEGKKLDDVAKLLTNEFQAARKQIEFVRKCLELSRAKKYDLALAEARKGIAVYPRSTLARVCVADIYGEQNMGPDSMIKISEEILAVHPQNRRALAFAADAYSAKKMDEKQVDALTRLLAADPTNLRLQQRVVEVFAASGKPEKALPIIDSLVQANPSQADLVRMQWLIHLTVGDFKGAIAIGEAMEKSDTAAADTSFYVRMVAAAVRDSQPAKAAEIAGRGVTKFSSNDGLAVGQVQLLRKAGALDKALAAVNALTTRNPKAPGAWLQKAQIQNELKAPADTLIETLKQAVAYGDDAATVSGYALVWGNQLYKGTAATATKTPQDFRQAITYARWAETTSPSANAKTLLAASTLSLGLGLLQEAQPAKSCDLSKEAQAAFDEVQTLLPQVGTTNRDAAKSLAENLMKYSAVPGQFMKAYCK